MTQHRETTTIKYFEYEHLPDALKKVSKPFCDLATELEFDMGINPSAEKSAGMRKLLEAKDCFVRASMNR